MAIASTSPSSSTPQTLQDRFFAADRAVQSGDYQQALSICQQLVAEKEDYAPAYYLMADLYSRLNQTEKALKLNDFALRFMSQSFEIFFQRGKLMFVLSRWEEAQEAFASARAIQPNNAVTVMLMGDVQAQLGNHEAAVKLFTEAAAIEDLPEILEHKGLSQISCDDKEGARASFRALLRRIPNYAAAHLYLAQMDAAEGDEAAAEEHLRKAIMIDPNHSEALSRLSEMLLYRHDYQESLALGRRAIAADPHHVAHVLRAMKVIASEGYIEEVEQTLRTLLSRHPNETQVMVRLAHVLAPRGKTQEALVLIEKAIEKLPNNKALKHTRAALMGEAPSSMPEDYVANLFDSYSFNFDDHLQKLLNYHTPQLIAQALRLLLDTHRANYTLLDLGCGTGLAAEALADITGLRVGVDLSPKMIEKAKAKLIYSETYVDELVRYMEGDARHYDLVVAADVLVYMGDLEALFAQSAAHLVPGGLFIVSTERAESGDDYQIRQSGRYAHTDAYVHRLAQQNGLELVQQQVCDLRKEAGSIIKGTVYIMRNSG